MSRLMGLLPSTPVTVLDGPAAAKSAALGLTLRPPMPLARLASLCTVQGAAHHETQYSEPFPESRDNAGTGRQWAAPSSGDRHADCGTRVRRQTGRRQFSRKVAQHKHAALRTALVDMAAACLSAASFPWSLAVFLSFFAAAFFLAASDTILPLRAARRTVVHDVLGWQGLGS